MIFLIFLLLSSCLCDPIIELPDGRIRGIEVVSVTGFNFFAFRGIPYAAPPINSLRFQAPQPPKKWDDILDATESHAVCYQLAFDIDQETEDCLYINVFTPSLPDERIENLPVMIFIYGGGFNIGFAQWYYPDFIVERNVILVTFNYRLGIFGFLSTEDDVVPGNAALKDQKQAIKWTYDNIEFFGGDPENIFIFGESAGAASVSYQLLNQENNFIKGAILQSGTSLGNWALQRNARERAFQIASHINSTFESLNDSQILLDFLQNVDPQILEEAELSNVAQYETPANLQIFQGFFWAPVIENKNPSAFLTKKMYGLMAEGNFLKVPIIIGITSEESLTLTGTTDEFQILMQAYDNNTNWIVPQDMHIDESNATRVGTIIKNFYTNGSNLADNLGLAAKFSSDNILNRAVIKHAQLSSQYVPTYFYQFSYDGFMGLNNIHYDGADSVGHAEDIGYLLCFLIGCNEFIFPESDKVTRRVLADLWTNFAKFQNPTPDDFGVVWPPVDTSNGDFLYLSINETLIVENKPKWKYFQFWDDLYQNSGFSDFDTY